MLTSAGAALGRVPLFAALDQDDLEKIVGASTACRYGRGSVVFQEGEPGDTMLVLLSGRVKVVLPSDSGREVILAVLEPPDVLGHVALLDGAPRSATVIALEPLEARRLTRDYFLQLVAKNRQILDALLKRVYPGFPIRLGALPGFVVGDRMWKALWKLVENEQRFPRRGGRVLCVHGAVSFHRARPCGRPVCRPGRHEGSLEPYRQNCG